MHIVLSYFNQLLGPAILHCYPEEKLEEGIIQKLMRFFDLEIEESFFEIILINKQKRVINLYFHVPSKWARGRKEMTMLSLIMSIKYDSRLIYTFLVDASHKIMKTEDIYKGFYKHDDYHDDNEIDMYYEIIKKILFECLGNLIARLETKKPEKYGL